MQVAVSSNLSIDFTVIKSNILIQFFLCKHLDQMPSNTKYHSELVITYPNQNTPGVKKVAAKNLKKGRAEKDVKSKWAAKASCC